MAGVDLFCLGTSKPVIRLALVPIDPKLGAESIKASCVCSYFLNQQNYFVK
jgi:hypothetical protein